MRRKKLRFCEGKQLVSGADKFLSLTLSSIAFTNGTASIIKKTDLRFDVLPAKAAGQETNTKNDKRN